MHYIVIMLDIVAIALDNVAMIIDMEKQSCYNSKKRVKAV